MSEWDEGREELDEEEFEDAPLDDEEDAPPELDDDDDSSDPDQPDPDQEDLDEDGEPATPEAASPERPLPAHVARNAEGRLYDKRTGNFLPNQPQAPQTPAQQAPGEAAADDPIPETPEGATPLQFSANKQPFHVRGSYQTEDGGYYIPRQSAADVTRLLAAGQHHLTHGREQYLQWQREREQLLQQRSQKDIEAQHVLDFYADLVGKGADAVMDYVADLQNNWPRLQAEARAKALEAQLQARIGPEQQEQQQRYQQQLLQQAEDGLEKAIYRTVEQRFRDAGLTDQDLVPVYRQLRSVLDSVIFQADQDIPGVARKGQLVVDYEPIELAIAHVAQLKQGTTQQVQRVATESKRAATFNARRGGHRTPPPAVRGAKAPSGDPSKGPRRVRRPASREEADALFSRPVDEVNAEIGYDPSRR